MNIALLTGGLSSEREVSLTSSKSIAAGLREAGHTVKVIDPVYGDASVSEEDIFKDTVKRDHPTPRALEKLKAKANRNIITCINSSLFDDMDMVFLGLHGKLGEDGRIQTLLEMRGMKYTGSDIISSAIALNKHHSKILFRHNDVPTPDWLVINKNDALNTDEIGRKVANSFGLPCVIKPNDEGSTIGLTIVQPDVEDAQLPSALDSAFKYSNKVIIEKCIPGRELTVTIIGDEAYPVIEIKPEGGFYDYEHKYTKGMTEYICPAEIPGDVEKKAKEYGLKAHRICGCSVYSRVDFVLGEDNSLYCLEVNTLPGMTETSLVPKSAKALGLSFSQLLDKIIQLSLNK